MKVLVLLAGLIGVLGFFQPFYAYRGHEVSAYRIVRSAEEPGSIVAEITEVRAHEYMVAWPQVRPRVEPSSRTSPVPIYFASAIVMILVAFVAFAMRRLSGFGALFSLAAGMLAIGGWLNELRVERDRARAGFEEMLTTGGTLLLVSGLLGLAASLVVLIKREPNRPQPPPKPPAIELPVARVIS
jgi:hypothetical protein